MLRASASLITTSSVLCRHLVVFHGFPRNFSENVALSCQAHLRNARFPHANSDQFSRSWFIVFSRYIPKATEIQVESKGVCTLRLAAPSPRKSTRFNRKTQTENWMETQCFLESLSWKSKVKISFNRWFFSRVAGHLCTWILAEIIEVPYLRITPGTQQNKGKNDLRP